MVIAQIGIHACNSWSGPLAAAVLKECGAVIGTYARVDQSKVAVHSDNVVDHGPTALVICTIYLSDQGRTASNQDALRRSLEQAIVRTLDEGGHRLISFCLVVSVVDAAASICEARSEPQLARTG